MLCYTMGEKSEEILKQILPDTKAQTTLDTVKEKFSTYFSPKKNTIFERYKFNSRTQQSEENVDSFITALHMLAESCEYGTLKDELIRDRIVIGIRDSRTSERLQLTSDLTLEKAITLVRQAETQAKEGKNIRRDVTQRTQLRFQTQQQHFGEFQEASRKKFQGKEKGVSVLQMRSSPAHGLEELSRHTVEMPEVQEDRSLGSSMPVK